MYVRFSLSLRNVVDLLNNRLKIATAAPPPWPNGSP